jgi:hypothetical protein
MSQTTHTEIEGKTMREWFNHYCADEITVQMGEVSGWVPAGNAESLVQHLDAPEIQYYTDDGFEAYVTTL